VARGPSPAPIPHAVVPDEAPPTPRRGRARGARDWDQFHGAKDLAIRIATAAAELLALFRFATEGNVEEALDQSRAEIQDELADILIFVLRFGQRFDLARAVRAKLAANERRYPVEVARGSNPKAP
jgi:NTP pyrophosphatase (non-canonical NTP hydrolase)